MKPRYPFPWKTGLQLIRDAFLSQPRSFRDDAIVSIRKISPPPVILNPENIPSNDPCLLVTNHYSRPGFDAWWIALVISAVVPMEIHWMMTAAWTFLGPLEPITRWLFPRLARVYGFTTTPPMPPDPREVEARARAVRQVLQVARSQNAMIAIAPEGRDHPGGIIGTPPPGAGRFICLLNKYYPRIVPIAVYEDGGKLFCNFGPAFNLDISPVWSSDERDRQVSQQVMRAIARQLPT